jgi:glutaminyl-peptide cyclotransferase
MRRQLCALALALVLVACVARSTTETQFDGKKAYGHVLEQAAIGPRPAGSEEAQQTADYITGVLDKLGWTVESQEFVYNGIVGRNVVASRGGGGVIILGAHYDTRPLADRDPVDPSLPVPGANDGASGVAVLLELARVLDLSESDVQVWLMFFDAEDRGGINGWPFSVGATYAAQRLTVDPRAVVIVDMVGDADQQFFWEQNSDPQLNRQLWAVAADLGYEDYFIPRNGPAIIDDHLPFLQRGLSAVDIIDFDYPYWHTTEDTADKVSSASLERVGRVLEAWLESAP